jgi:hypothetical protein
MSCGHSWSQQSHPGLRAHATPLHSCPLPRFVVTDGYEGDPQLLTRFATKCRSDPTCRSSAAPSAALSIAWSVPERSGRR